MSMNNKPEFDLQTANKYFSAHCFNQAWNLIDKQNRSPQEDDDMLNLSHASLWHWTQREDFNAEKASIAYWQLARIYVLLNQPDNASRYAHLCLQASQEEGVGLFFLGYAHEALARAASVAGNQMQADAHRQAAEDIASKLTDVQGRQMLLDDLQTIN
jgi:hypothetical protein